MQARQLQRDISAELEAIGDHFEHLHRIWASGCFRRRLHNGQPELLCRIGSVFANSGVGMAVVVPPRRFPCALAVLPAASLLAFVVHAKLEADIRRNNVDFEIDAYLTEQLLRRISHLLGRQPYPGELA